jgi:hypothetical protein
MSTIEEIKSAISHLPRKELVRLRAWFEEFEAEEWDRQFVEDVQNGKLDKLAKQATKEFQDGKCTEL